MCNTSGRLIVSQNTVIYSVASQTGPFGRKLTSQNLIKNNEWLFLLASLLLFSQSVLRKVNEEDAQQIARPIMDALLQMLSLGGRAVSGVQEDALMAIGTLVEGIQIHEIQKIFSQNSKCSLKAWSPFAKKRPDNWRFWPQIF